MKLYGDGLSGNCYKIRLLMSFLDTPHEWVHVDVTQAETRTPEFIALNANAKIPVLVLDDGNTLNESNAILNYLARDSAYIPSDALEHARMLSWQFFEQYSHEPYIAVARFINIYLGMPPDRADEYASKQEGGNKALQVMEDTLITQPYLVGDSLTLADISLFAYTHVAEEGGFDLEAYPSVKAWLTRVCEHPGFVPMQSTA